MSDSQNKHAYSCKFQVILNGQNSPLKLYLGEIGQLDNVVIAFNCPSYMESRDSWGEKTGLALFPLNHADIC